MFFYATFMTKSGDEKLIKNEPFSCSTSIRIEFHRKKVGTITFIGVDLLYFFNNILFTERGVRGIGVRLNSNNSQQIDSESIC